MGEHTSWKYGDPSAVPDDVREAVGTTLGAAAFHPSIENLLVDVGRGIVRRRRNERRRLARLHNRTHPQISSAPNAGEVPRPLDAGAQP